MNIELLNKAIFLTQNGKYKEAEDLYLEMINQNPDNFILLSAFGLFYVNLNKFNLASKYLEKAYNINKTLGTVSALGFCEFEQQNYEKSASILEEALRYGDSENVYDKLILSLFYLQDYAKAIIYANKMYELYPKSVHAITNQIKALTQSGKLLEAEKLCVETLKENQEISSLWFHLGFLKELIYSDDKQACECYKIALDLGNLDANYNIAVSYQKQGLFDKAESYYKKLLEHNPKDINTLTSLGMCYLTQKKFKDGYKYFFNRESANLNKLVKKYLNIGEEFDKKVLVVCDQGFGDHIQFARYLPLLKEKVKEIQVATPNSLIDLFKQNYPDIEFKTYKEVDYNLQTIRITDLAYLLDMDFDNIPFANGYLNSDTADIKSDKIKVGLCWEAGAAGIRTMINRTINIKMLEPILNLKNIQLYSFQVKDSLNGNEKYPQMINLAKDFKNFNDTAKALKAMDVIITVDTSVAHLAGALGVKTFLLLPKASDWRWFKNNKTTEWYNSVEIFKQIDPINWEEPINNIINQLSK